MSEDARGYIFCFVPRALRCEPEAGGLRAVRPTALNTVRRSRQLPRMAPSIEASSFSISWRRSDWSVVGGGVVPAQASSFGDEFVPGPELQPESTWDGS